MFPRLGAGQGAWQGDDNDDGNDDGDDSDEAASFPALGQGGVPGRVIHCPLDAHNHLQPFVKYTPPVN